MVQVNANMGGTSEANIDIFALGGPVGWVVYGAMMAINIYYIHEEINTGYNILNQLKQLPGIKNDPNDQNSIPSWSENPTPWLD